MTRQCALRVLLLLLGLLSPLWALADASGWRIQFLAAPDLACTDYAAARQREDWREREVDMAALAASRALWMRLTPTAPAAPAVIVARNQVRSAIGEPTYTVSIGVAQREAGEPVVDWIARADAALYRAKSGGRNRIELACAAGLPDRELQT